MKRLGGDIKKIAELCGVSTAVTIMKMFGGCRIYIPNLSDSQLEMRDQSIREAFKQGVPARQLARQHRITERRVFQIVSKGDS